jgi:hypothetical protein
MAKQKAEPEDVSRTDVWLGDSRATSPGAARKLNLPATETAVKEKKFASKEIHPSPAVTLAIERPLSPPERRMGVVAGRVTR